jgi:hypothetical protein
MPRQKRQPSFEFVRKYERVEHGGGIRKGLRKEKRPFDARRPLHLTFRATRARGELSMLKLKNEKWIRAKSEELGRRFSVRIYEYGNAGNHLHMLVRASSEEGFRNFLRTFAALVARRVTGAKKGNPQGRFWDELAYSKLLLTWGREFFHVRHYVIRNLLEGMGILAHSDRAFDAVVLAKNRRRAAPS